MKTSVIDMVLGDGSGRYRDNTDEDTLEVEGETESEVDEF